MKSITVQSFQGEERVEESKLTLADNDLLIVQCPPDIPIQTVKKVHDIITDGLETERQVVAIPQTVTYKVIST